MLVYLDTLFFWWGHFPKVQFVFLKSKPQWNLLKRFMQQKEQRAFIWKELSGQIWRMKGTLFINVNKSNGFNNMKYILNKKKKVQSKTMIQPHNSQ